MQYSIALFPLSRYSCGMLRHDRMCISTVYSTVDSQQVMTTLTADISV